MPIEPASPPSVSYADISPTRGEIGNAWHTLSQNKYRICWD